MFRRVERDPKGWTLFIFYYRVMCRVPGECTLVAGHGRYTVIHAASKAAPRVWYGMHYARYGHIRQFRVFHVWLPAVLLLQASRTVERIGARIAQASGLEGCKWEFIVVKNDAMNAFALPGGKVR